MNNQNESYGVKIAYDPMWKGPIEVHRNTTDFKFLKFFGIYLVIWIAIGAYAFSTGNSHDNYIRSARAASYNSKSLTPDDISKALIDSIWTFLGCIVFSGVLCVLYIYGLRHYARTIVWTMIGLICFSFVALIFLILTTDTSNPNGPNNNDDAKTVTAGFLAIVLAIIIMVVIICRKKIDIACEVVREASKATLHFPSLFALPVPTFIFNTILLAFFLTVFVYLNTIDVVNQLQKSNTIHIKFFHLFNIFGYMWVFNFIMGYGQMVMCCSFATWYWTMNKNNVPDNTVMQSINTTSKFHMGTVALGAMIITLCQIIEYFLKKIKHALKSTWCCCCFGMCLYNAYVYCFGNVERFVRYINVNALIMSSVHGTDFFDSARMAFNLIMRNAVKAFITTKITKWVIHLGALLTTTVSGGIAFYLLNTRLEVKEAALAVAILVGVVALLLSTSFLKVLDTAVDTVLLCALEDYERNDGSSDRPYYMSYEMKRLMLEDTAGV